MISCSSQNLLHRQKHRERFVEALFESYKEENPTASKEELFPLFLEAVEYGRNEFAEEMIDSINAATTSGYILEE